MICQRTRVSLTFRGFLWTRYTSLENYENAWKSCVLQQFQMGCCTWAIWYKRIQSRLRSLLVPTTSWMYFDLKELIGNNRYFRSQTGVGSRIHLTFRKNWPKYRIEIVHFVYFYSYWSFRFVCFGERIMNNVSFISVGLHWSSSISGVGGSRPGIRRHTVSHLNYQYNLFKNTIITWLH